MANNTKESIKHIVITNARYPTTGKTIPITFNVMKNVSLDLIIGKDI